MTYIGQLKSIHRCARSVVTIKKWSLSNGLNWGNLIVHWSSMLGWLSPLVPTTFEMTGSTKDL